MKIPSQEQLPSSNRGSVSLSSGVPMNYRFLDPLNMEAARFEAAFRIRNNIMQHLGFSYPLFNTRIFQPKTPEHELLGHLTTAAARFVFSCHGIKTKNNFRSTGAASLDMCIRAEQFCCWCVGVLVPGGQMGLSCNRGSLNCWLFQKFASDRHRPTKSALQTYTPTN